MQAQPHQNSDVRPNVESEGSDIGSETEIIGNGRTATPHTHP